jgi:hypothetical protein
MGCFASWGVPGRGEFKNVSVYSALWVRTTKIKSPGALTGFFLTSPSSPLRGEAFKWSGLLGFYPLFK